MTLGEAITGTFLEKVAEVLASGQFIEPKEAAAPDETIVGEMNEFEKALYTVATQINDATIKLMPQHDCKCADPRACACPEPPPEVVQECMAATANIEAISQILVASTFNRFKNPETLMNGILLRKGFKIALCPPEPQIIFFPAPGGFAPPGGTPPKIGSA